MKNNHTESELVVQFIDNVWFVCNSKRSCAGDSWNVSIQLYKSNKMENENRTVETYKITRTHTLTQLVLILAKTWLFYILFSFFIILLFSSILMLKYYELKETNEREIFCWHIKERRRNRRINKYSEQFTHELANIVANITLYAW